MNLKQLLSAFSPQKAKQDEYKLRAKAKGLLSFQDLEFLLSNNSQSLQEILAENKDLKFTFDTKFNLEIPEGQTELKLENKIIFDNRNFHNLNLSQDDLEYLAKCFLEDTKEVKLVCNVNHSQFPEDAIGYFESLKAENGQIIADMCFTELDNSKFQDQLRACKNGAEFGFSIEIGFDSYSVSKSGELKLSEPHLTGLATTLIPSAPATLSELSAKPETKAKSLADSDNVKITDKPAEPIAQVKKELVMANEIKLKNYVKWNLGDGDQIGEVIAILRSGQVEVITSKTPIIATENDPIAIIQIYEKLDDDKKVYTDGEIFTAHPFSILEITDEPREGDEYIYYKEKQDKKSVNFDGQTEKNSNKENLNLETQPNENEKSLSGLKIDQEVSTENIKDLSEIIVLQNKAIENLTTKLETITKSLSKTNKISALY
jgi:hypothetical protein